MSFESLLLRVALIVNLAVLLPVCYGMLSRADWAAQAYGDASRARDLLLAVYLAIALCSAVLIAIPLGHSLLMAGLMLLCFQVVYKLLSLYTLGGMSHPVAKANLLIALTHLSIIGLILYRKS